MFKLKSLFRARQHLYNKYLQSKSLRIVSIYSSSDKRSQQVNDAQRSKPFLFWANVGALIGAGYICYELYQKMQSERKGNYLFQALCPEVEAFCNDCSANRELISPRARFNFLADVAEKTASSVVYIEMIARHPITDKNIPLSNGSGFIVRSDGLILTNAHVVSQRGRVIVRLYDGVQYEGIVEDYDSEGDLATVRINAENLPVLPLGYSSELRPGEFVIAMGNPLTLSHTITIGVVSTVNRSGKALGLGKHNDFIQTDAAVNVGNSGGPLVNLDGEAIGINTMKITEGISFAIPSDRAVEFLNNSESLRKSGIKKPGSIPDINKPQKYLGITMLTLTEAIIQELQGRNPDFPNVEYGVMVWRVMFDSPSYESGIRHGDVITSINGKQIVSANEIYKLLRSEDVLSIHVIRGKKELDIVVKLMDPY